VVDTPLNADEGWVDDVQPAPSFTKSRAETTSNNDDAETDSAIENIKTGLARSVVDDRLKSLSTSVVDHTHQDDNLSPGLAQISIKKGASQTSGSYIPWTGGVRWVTI
jgi:hypothetical protein